MTGQAEDPGTGDERLGAVVRLVQETFPDGGRSDEGGLRRLQQRMSRGRRRRRLAFGTLGLLVAAAPLALVLSLRPAPLTFEVIHGAVGAAGEVRPTEPGTRIRFSDGTEIVLEGAARAQVRDVAAHGAGIVLLDGRAHTSFIRKPKARWQVMAGPYVVRVTGTVFDVAWSRDREQLDVWLTKGSVVVTGPLVEGGVSVGRDQHLSLRPGDHRIMLENGAAPAEETPPGGPPATRGPAEETAPAAAAPSIEHAADRAAAPRLPEASWQRRLAAGDFDSVIAGAERRGVREVLARGSRSDLAALADAARYTRRPELARRALLAQRARFPESTEAREAGYFLGVLAEDEGASDEALSWYARYRREDPAGTYAAPALGRTLVLEARHEGSDAARVGRPTDLARVCRRSPGPMRPGWARAALLVALLGAAARADGERGVALVIRGAPPDAAAAEVLARIRGELRAARFDVTVVPAADGAPRQVVEAAAHRASVAAGMAIFFDAAEPEVWVAVARSGRTTVEPLMPPDGERRPSVLAAKAVELLKAALTEVPSGERPPPPVPAPAPPVLVSAPAAPAPPAGRAADRVLLAGAGWLRAGGVQTISPSVSFAWLDVAARHHLGARFVAAGLGTSAAETGAAGTARLKQDLALLEVLACWQPARGLRACLAAGGGAGLLTVRGTGAPGYEGIDHTLWSGLGAAGGSVIWTPGRWIALGADARAVGGWPSTDVRIGGVSAVRAGGPGVALTAGVGGSL